MRSTRLTWPPNRAATGRFAVPCPPRLVVQKIVANFGSVEAAPAASDEELAAVDGVGPARAKEIREGVRRLVESVMADRF